MFFLFPLLLYLRLSAYIPWPTRHLSHVTKEGEGERGKEKGKERIMLFFSFFFLTKKRRERENKAGRHGRTKLCVHTFSPSRGKRSDSLSPLSFQYMSLPLSFFISGQVFPFQRERERERMKCSRERESCAGEGDPFSFSLSLSLC